MRMINVPRNADRRVIFQVEKINRANIQPVNNPRKVYKISE
jgi:hypothetical protein